MKNYIVEAVQSLRPGVPFVFSGDYTYECFLWHGEEADKPTQAELEAEAARLEADFKAKTYQRQRAAEYPSITDYIDGVVKGDQAQIDAYIAACQAVKAKYPKPE